MACFICFWERTERIITGREDKAQCSNRYGTKVISNGEGGARMQNTGHMLHTINAGRKLLQPSCSLVIL